MSTELPELNTLNVPESYLPLGDEYLFFSKREVNASAIDPKTMALLSPVAQEVSAEVRMSEAKGGDLVVMSASGLELEEKMGKLPFGEMMQCMSDAATELIDNIFPPTLVAGLKGARPDAMSALATHSEKMMEWAKKGIDTPWGQLKLLGIGGQSMAVYMKFEKGLNEPIECVVKTVSPLALIGDEDRSLGVLIIEPLTTELLRREVFIHDKVFQERARQDGFGMSGAYLATPHMMIEPYIEGAHPDPKNPSHRKLIDRFAKGVEASRASILGSRLSGRNTKMLMSGFSEADVIAPNPDPYIPPENWARKTDNFIFAPDGQLMCVDPFLPTSLLPRENQRYASDTVKEEIAEYLPSSEIPRLDHQSMQRGIGGIDLGATSPKAVAPIDDARDITQPYDPHTFPTPPPQKPR